MNVEIEVRGQLHLSTQVVGTLGSGHECPGFVLGKRDGGRRDRGIEGGGRDRGTEVRQRNGGETEERREGGRRDVGIE